MAVDPVSTSDPRVIEKALKEARSLLISYPNVVKRLDAALAALDAVPDPEDDHDFAAGFISMPAAGRVGPVSPAPDREKVKAAIEKALPGQMLTHRMLNRAADAAIAAGAGTGPLQQADDLLRRLEEWDMLASPQGKPVTADGPFWRGEIAKVRAAIAAMRGGE